MIRRLLSLLFGIVGCWVLLMLGSHLFLSLSPADLILQAALGKEAFLLAVGLLLASWLVMHVALSKLPLVKRGWASAGGALCVIVLALYALLLFGGSLVSI